MNAEILLALDEDDPEELQRLVRELADAVRHETGAQAAPVERPARPGEKGAAEVLGHVAVALLEAGALTTLFKVLGSFVGRRRGLVLTVKRGDAEVRVEGASAAEREALLRLLTEDA